MPFQIFLGIFSSLDPYSKKIVTANFREHRRVPSWLPAGEPIPVPHWSKFSCTDPVSNIKLIGTPDEMLRLASGRLYIIDYKTARITNHQDDLLSMYQTQLNAYAWIADQLGIGSTERLAGRTPSLMGQVEENIQQAGRGKISAVPQICQFTEYSQKPWSPRHRGRYWRRNQWATGLELD